jgi:5-methylcytosine-specific restriction endonuclease McrA
MPVDSEARREAARQRASAWYYANRERALDRQKAYAKANRDRLNAYNREWYARNREKEKIRSRDYRAANPEKRKAIHQAYYSANHKRELARSKARREANPEYHKKYYVANQERLRLKGRAYYKANRDRWNNNLLQRRLNQARRNARFQGTVSDRDWQRLVNRFGGLCAYCGLEPWRHVDHVVPLSRGGRHTIGNVLPACEQCNMSKGPKLLIEWRRIGKRGVHGLANSQSAPTSRPIIDNA